MFCFPVHDRWSDHIKILHRTVVVAPSDSRLGRRRKKKNLRELTGPTGRRLTSRLALGVFFFVLISNFPCCRKTCADRAAGCRTRLGRRRRACERRRPGDALFSTVEWPPHQPTANGFRAEFAPFASTTRGQRNSRSCQWFYRFRAFCRARVTPSDVYAAHTPTRTHSPRPTNTPARFVGMKTDKDRVTGTYTYTRAPKTTDTYRNA